MSPERGKAADACPREGRYANYFEIGQNAFEFILDFGQFYAEDDEARFHTRIIMGPAYAGALLDTLRKAIDRYIDSYGPIPERESQGNGDAQ